MGLFVIGLNHKECPVPLRVQRRDYASAINEVAVGIKADIKD